MRLHNLHLDIETLEEYTREDAQHTLDAFADIEAGIQEEQKLVDQNLEFLDKLEISYGYNDGPSVSLNELVSILKDEKRMKKISSMLKNKAFW